MTDGTPTPGGNAVPGGRPPRGQHRERRPAPPPEPAEGFTAVGQVLRPHGLRGEIRVRAFAPSAPNLQRGRRIYLEGVRRTVLRARFDRDAWILQLEGLTDRNAVEGSRGELLEMPDAEVRRDDSESFFIHELVGLTVLGPGGAGLGTVSEVIQTGANDVYVVRGPLGEILVPAIADVVEEIDLRAGVMRITPLAGMLAESQ